MCQVAPGEAKRIDVPIAVPAGTQAGGYFGAIRFVPSILGGGGQVNMSASVASLVLLSVPGNTVETLELTDFSVLQGTQPGSLFRTGDIHALIRFQNKGNVQTGPFGKVSVLRGDQVLFEVDLNNKKPRDMILPDSARRWNIPLKNIDGFGRYTVRATFTYGQQSKTIETETVFWVISWTVMAILAAGPAGTRRYLCRAGALAASTEARTLVLLSRTSSSLTLLDDLFCKCHHEILASSV